MTKKSIQKLTKFLTSKSLKISKGILLGILVASLFLPIFSPTNPNIAKADDCNISIGTVVNTGVYVPGTDSVGVNSSRTVVDKDTVLI